MRNVVRQLRSAMEPTTTQQDLADALGVSRQTVNAIEQGRYEPKLRLAMAIAKHFGRAVEEVFPDDDTHTDNGSGPA